MIELNLHNRKVKVNMARKIYFVHTCNERKEYSSMRLVFIGTSKQKLKMLVAKLIEEGTLEYHCYDGATPKQQARVFRKHWEKEPVVIINSYLVYGDINYTYNNEEM